MDRSQRFLARRYALAFLEVNGNALSFVDIQAFDKAVVFFKTHKQVSFLLDLTLLTFESKRQAITQFLNNLHLPDCCSSLFELVLRHKRSSLFPEIFDQLSQLYRIRLNILHFTVESALPLLDEDKHAIELFLKNQVTATIECSYEVDKNLIAGVRIHNEKYLWEYSAKAQLRALSNTERR